MIINERHLTLVLREYVNHYNGHRPHQSRQQRPPDIEKQPIRDVADLRTVRRKPAVTGLINEYHHAALHQLRLRNSIFERHTIIEAGERGLADILGSEFEPAPDALASVLTCCDMTTSPDGEAVPVDKRLAEIHDRYGPGHLVSRSIRRATPMILRAVEQVHDRADQTASFPQTGRGGMAR